ncbi:Tn3 family transposase [Streptomyces sp. NPDC051286]|uniref:Tn3 family transposase n=1 Tax=Streptomyces sp. NPDC051286 TaxID=3365647 RepID=UPI003795DBEE
MSADYGPLQVASRHTVRLDRIRAHWGDMLRVAGSLILGEVRGHDLIRMLSRDGRPTGLGDAFAHYGRIFKILHLLQFISDDGYRRMIGKQLNITEARHRLARRIFFGRRGELRQNYHEGMEDQLGALGLALNAVVLSSSLYLDRAAKQLAADGFPVTDDLLARLSPCSSTTPTSSAATRSSGLRRPAAGRCVNPRPARRTMARGRSGRSYEGEIARAAALRKDCAAAQSDVSRDRIGPGAVGAAHAGRATPSGAAAPTPAASAAASTGARAGARHYGVASASVGERREARTAG